MKSFAELKEAYQERIGDLAYLNEFLLAVMEEIMLPNPDDAMYPLVYADPFGSYAKCVATNYATVFDNLMVKVKLVYTYDDGVDVTDHSFTFRKSQYNKWLATLTEN